MLNKGFLTTLSNFIESHCSSFCWFLAIGLGDALQTLQIYYSLNKIDFFEFLINHYFFLIPNKTFKEIYTSRLTFNLKLYIPIHIFYTDLNLDLDINEEVLKTIPLCLGEIPIMTNYGSFIVNGYEKVIINQLIRLPGIYFLEEFFNYTDITQKALIIPEQGSWISIEFNNSESLTISLDKSNKIDFITFLSFFSDFYYDYFFNFLNILGLNLSVVEFSNLSFNSLENLISIKTNYQLLLFDINFFNLGILVRSQLNDLFPYLNIPAHKSLLTIQDFFEICYYLIYRCEQKQTLIDFDHLGYKSIKLVGHLFFTYFIDSLHFFQRKINILSTNFISYNEFFFQLNELIFDSIITPFFSNFFRLSQLVQFLDQTNAFSEIAHHRRFYSSNFSTNLSTISINMRDIQPSYFNRICPIETSEGETAGLISALTIYGRINDLGLIETPFFLVLNGYVLYSFPVIYLTSFEEEYFKIAPINTKLNALGKILDPQILIYFQSKFYYVSNLDIQLMAISPLQLFSFGVSLIPFFEHNDANRVLMGANMQRQAIPLLFPQKPIIGTGLEMQAVDQIILKSFTSGYVFSVTNNYILIKTITNCFIRYFLQKYKKSNQNTCLNHSAIVWPGEFINSGQIIADGSSSESGELALGRNLLIAYMPWYGFNFEDSILINERLIFNDIFTSITILMFSIFFKYTNSGPEYLISPTNLKQNSNSLISLDSNGIIKKGSFIKPFDFLILKMTPLNLFTKKFNFLSYFFNRDDNKNFENNTSILATASCYGRILDISFSAAENLFKAVSLNRFKILLFLAQIRKISVGDKLSGRHGNKGIISKIFSNIDMPFLLNGQSIDIILNPLGVPSRMNVGQLFEGLLGFAGKFLYKRFKILPFDEIFALNSSRILITKYLQKAQQFSKFFWLYNKFTPGKIRLRDGKTGNLFDNNIFICISYILKLNHFSIDKLQSRSTGPYSLMFQQPVHGKKKQGGQRFGEMEVWALEAFGAIYTLQEILTLKADTIIGRNSVLLNILLNKEFSYLGLPESFKVLLVELQALGLTISFYNTLLFYPFFSKKKI